jgi:hypothetical protein
MCKYATIYCIENSTLIFSKNNHLNYWYNDDPNNLYRQHWYDLLSFQLGGIQRPPKSFRQECGIAAAEIYELYPDIHIGLTGGLDSNVCLDSFLSTGIKPGIFIIKFKGDLNPFDADYALNKCKELDIDPVIVEIDPYEFVEEHIMSVAKEFQIYSMYQALHIHICRNFSFPFITVDEIELRRDSHPKSLWSFVKKEDQDMCWRRFASTTGVRAINNFYTWSPELMLSFLNIPTVEKLCTNKIPGKISWNSSKNLIYAEGGFPKFIGYKKTWGIEKITGLFNKSTARISKEFMWEPKECYIEYHKLREILINGGTTCQYI